MNRATFFAALRKRDSGVFGTSLSQGQVDGTDAMLDAMHGYPLSHAAHVLGEVYHETGGQMMPVKETVYASSKDRNPSDDTVQNRLENAFRAGKLPWVKTPYWRTGFFGRGQIQLTHESNYRRASGLVGVDLVKDPSRALDLPISAKIAAEGCRIGMFTGKALSDFDGQAYDHYNARAIVNGDKAANGRKVAAYAKAFEAALEASGWGTEPPVRPDVDPPAPPAREIPSGGLWASLVALLISIFKR